METLSIPGFRLALLALGFIAGPPPRSVFADHPNALWRVVHSLCVTDQRLSGFAAPCLAVDRARGYAVVPDPRGPTQVLLAPTRRIEGIESPTLLAPGGPNYWRYAWDARRYFERRAHRSVPRDDIAMAVNSIPGRTQNQLHIHIDCVRSDVREALKVHAARLPHGWAPFPVKLVGHRYRALRLDGDDLGARDPFKLLAEHDADARSSMGRQTLAVIGVSIDGTPGFVVLAANALDPENPDGAAEELLDHSCAVLR